MNFITNDVFYSSRDIKIEAKAQLEGNWKPAILLSLIPMLFSLFFIGDTTMDVANQDAGFDLIDLLLEFVHGFLLTGVAFTMLDYLRGRAEIEPLSGAVSGFKKEYFSGLLLLKVYKYLFIFLWTLLLIIPGIIKAFSYSQAEKIYKDRADQMGAQPDPRECLRESEAMMKGHKMELFALELSFIGWHFLALLTLGILYVWLTPYLTMAQVVFYENLLVETDSDLGMLDDYEELDERDINRPHSPAAEDEIGKDPDDFRDFKDY